MEGLISWFVSVVIVSVITIVLETVLRDPITRLLRKLPQAWLTLWTWGEFTASELRAAAEDWKLDWGARDWRGKLILVVKTLKLPVRHAGDLPDVLPPEDVPPREKREDE